jgi:argininosuccinate lyase
MKLWDKGTKLEGFIEEFAVGNLYLLDQRLVKHDCLASIAHAKTLEKAGIISSGESRRLACGLKRIIGEWEKGRFRIRREQEDSHTAIEEYLTSKLGVVGKKIHAGRSRNDQVIAAIRLYSKEKLLEAEAGAIALCREMLSFAEKHEWVAVPGYTHSRRAMVSSIGLWAGSIVEALLDSAKMLDSAFGLADCSPLGSAAGFGSSLPLDRGFTAKLLGFERVQNNVLYVQSSRGKFEAAIIGALSQVMLDLGKAASDIILFSSQEFGFLKLPPEICFGSSIMPQKQNPDVLELVRAKSKKVQAMLFQCLSIAGSVGSSYHSDLQLTKGPLLDSFDETIGSLKAMRMVFGKLRVDKKKCSEACSPEIFAADLAVEMAKKGVPFREAYRRVAGQLHALNAADAVKNIKSKRMQGATGNLGFGEIKRDIAAREKAIAVKTRKFRSVLGKLL